MAVALGKLAAGHKKENATKADRARRGERGKLALIRWHLDQGHDVKPELAKAV